MTEFERLGAHPSLGQVAQGVNQVHDCLEDHREDSRRRHAELERRVEQGFEILMHDQRILMGALRIDPRPETPTPPGDDREVTPPHRRPSRARGKSLATMSAWELAWTVAMGTGPVLALWSWGGKLIPVIVECAAALNRAVTGT